MRHARKDWRVWLAAGAVLLAGCSKSAGPQAAGGSTHDAGVRLAPEPAYATSELAVALDLPDVDLAPGPQHAQSYFEALRAGDRRDWRALMQVWLQRFENITIGGRE